MFCFFFFFPSMSVFVFSSFLISVSVYNKRYTDTHTFSCLLCVCVHDSSPCSFSFCKHCFFSGQMQMYILVSLPFSWFVCLFFLPVEITFFFCLNRFSCLNINRTWGVSVFMCVCVCSWWFFLLLYFALLRMCVCVCVCIGVGYCDVSC